jgi:hypothetical protein
MPASAEPLCCTPTQQVVATNKTSGCDQQNKWLRSMPPLSRAAATHLKPQYTQTLHPSSPSVGGLYCWHSLQHSSMEATPVRASLSALPVRAGPGVARTRLGWRSLPHPAPLRGCPGRASPPRPFFGPSPGMSTFKYAWQGPLPWERSPSMVLQVRDLMVTGGASLGDGDGGGMGGGGRGGGGLAWAGGGGLAWAGGGGFAATAAGTSGRRTAPLPAPPARPRTASPAPATPSPAAHGCVSRCDCARPGG